MKKVFAFIFIVVLIAFTGYVLLQVPAVKSTVSSVTGIGLYKELIPYDNNFEINKLKISNQSFYYNTLSDVQKNIYKCVANGIKNYESNFVLQDYEVVDSDTTMKDVEKSMQAFFTDHPEVFYVDNEYTISTKKTLFNSYVELNVTYTIKTKEELDAKINEVETKINEYLSEAEGKDGFDAELILHDKLGQKIEYFNYEKIEDVPQECHSIYGAFVNGKAVCDGFSKALQILLDRKGIENILVLGTLENESHAWNLVKLDDEWYNVDLTSDKAIKDVDANIILHTYFNATTSKMETTHKYENKEIIPQATGEKYNYYNKTNKVIKASTNFNTKFRLMLENNDNKYLLEFATEGISDVPTKMVDFLSANKYNEYVSNNKITYYTISDVCVLMKNN